MTSPHAVSHVSLDDRQKDLHDLSSRVEADDRARCGRLDVLEPAYGPADTWQSSPLRAAAEPAGRSSIRNASESLRSLTNEERAISKMGIISPPAISHSGEPDVVGARAGGAHEEQVLGLYVRIVRDILRHP